MTLPALHTQRLSLLIADPAEAAAVASYFHINREHLQPSSPRFPTNIGAVEPWKRRLEHNRDLARAGWEYRFFLSPKGQSRVIGTANLTEIARGPSQRCQLGFGLDASFTGQGLMGEALEALLNFAFGDLRLMKVNAGHLPDNPRSAALLQRLGFVREGVARNEVCINGQWRDHVLTARLNPHPERVQTDTTVNR